MKCFLIFACAIALASSQYVHSGWKPQGARLILPTEYGAPVAPVQPQGQDLEVEITKENIEFVGQLGETTTENVPTTTEFVTEEVTTEQAESETPEPFIQDLPDRDNSRSFHEQPDFKKRNGELRRIPARFQQQRFARVEQENVSVQGLYGAPPVPTTTVETPEEQPEVITEENLTNERDIEGADVEDEAVDATIAVANSGQYYVLAPDNTLQRVTFLTRQTEEDRRSNGFTAELRYAPVQPIRDPIYAYNEQGQLVQVYNNNRK